LIRAHQVVIVSGETGCGKSTQIPKMCLEAGRGIGGKIGCTQPRRIAAITIAHRIAQEMGENMGLSVGYKIRFRDKMGPRAFIKIMTDGMLLAETQSDPGLYEYDTLIIDEAHERTLNIDFILGMLKNLLPSRPELKVIITSATLDTEKFSAAFSGAPVVNVTGRLYPIDVEYMPLDSAMEERGEVTYIDMAVKAVDTLRSNKKSDDILVFMPTEEDILETCERLKGRRYPETEVLPLFARLAASEQGRVYSTSGPKIVVATNVAETSLTIPGIRYVIDTGLARIPRYLPRSRTTSLAVGPISRSSADQRKGRCGRVQNGVCIRLYTEEDYESRPVFTAPEIQRSNLAEVILRMLSLNLGHPSSFPFLDPPPERSIKDGFDLLLELDAVNKTGKDFHLTEKGRAMARMPIDPRISRMMIEAAKEGCIEDASVIASALSIQDPRERPVEQAVQADQMHAPFKDPDSDFLTLLNIWNLYHREWETLKTQNQMRRFCKQNFLSYIRMREWVYTHDQIMTILRELRMLDRNRKSPGYDPIHRAVLSGFLSNIAVKKEKNIYLAARGREVMLYPGSTLFKKAPAWIVAAEMVKTSRLFARTVARINPEWLEALGGELCKCSYSEPHWDARRGEVRAIQRVTLFGLVVVPGRSISYSHVDAEASHRIFIRSALVEGKVDNPPPFLVHNRKVAADLAAIENKLRRRDIVVDDSAVAEFYSERLRGVCDMASLRKLIKQRGGDEFLRLSREKLVLTLPDEAELAQYPDLLHVAGRVYPCEYAFAPGKEEDGVTVKVLTGFVSTIPSERLDWTVPGLLREKVTALIKGLPKRYRKLLVPVSQTVEVILQGMEHADGSLVGTLSDFVYRRLGADIPASVWAAVELPAHLAMRVAVVDHTGKELESGRDIHVLVRSDRERQEPESSAAWDRCRRKWERKGITSWDFDELPESLCPGECIVAYPALKAGDESADILLFRDREEALSVHRKGVRWLLARHFAKDLKFLRRNLALPKDRATAARFFGGTTALEKAMMEHVVSLLLEKNLRRAEEIKEAFEKLSSIIVESGMALKDQVLEILDAYNLAQAALLTAKGSEKRETEFSLKIGEELETLVPRGFLELYDADLLGRLPRYLKALRLRAERGANDPEKHRSRTAQVEPFTRSLKRFKESISPHTSRAKREAVEDFRWIIEEFKVSLFAQELKTAFPVSSKRLQEKEKEIERMM